MIANTMIANTVIANTTTANTMPLRAGYFRLFFAESNVSRRNAQRHCLRKGPTCA